MRILEAVLLIIVGMLLMFVIHITFFYTEPVTTGRTIDTLMIRKLKDYRMAIRNLPILRVDTFYSHNDSVKLMYTIPVMPFHFLDSIPITINKKRAYVPFDLHIDGYVTEYSIATTEREFFSKSQPRKVNWKLVGISSIGIGIVVLAVLLLK